MWIMWIAFCRLLGFIFFSDRWFICFAYEVFDLMPEWALSLRYQVLNFHFWYVLIQGKLGLIWLINLIDLFLFLPSYIVLPNQILVVLCEKYIKFMRFSPTPFPLEIQVPTLVLASASASAGFKAASWCWLWGNFERGFWEKGKFFLPFGFGR